MALLLDMPRKIGKAFVFPNCYAIRAHGELFLKRFSICMKSGYPLGGGSRISKRGAHVPYYDVTVHEVVVSQLILTKSLI